MHGTKLGKVSSQPLWHLRFWGCRLFFVATTRLNAYWVLTDLHQLSINGVAQQLKLALLSYIERSDI